MKLRAILDNGRIEFNRPIRLRGERIDVEVLVPDDELVTDDLYSDPSQTEELSFLDSLSPATTALLHDLSRLRGTNYRYCDNGLSDKEKAMNELSGHYR